MEDEFSKEDEDFLNKLDYDTVVQGLSRNRC